MAKVNGKLTEEYGNMLKKSFRITATTEREDGTGVARHLPEFIMEASSPREVILKVRAMFGEEVRVSGSVEGCYENGSITSFNH